MVSLILAAPFATAYPPLLEAVIRVMEAIVVNLWPRIDYYRGDILEGLIYCWCKILSEEATPSDALIRVRFAIEKVVKLMTAFLKTQRNTADDYQFLIAVDHRLRDLLIS